MSLIDGKELECVEAKDPVHQEEDKWFFWDESWVDRYGPYPSREFAECMCKHYCDWLNTGIMHKDFVEEIVMEK